MDKFQKSILAIGTAGFLVTAPVANATSFYVDNAVITLGSGYGIDASELSNNSPTLLDVQYSSSFVDQSFNLPAIGSSYTFVLGELGLYEPNTGGGILSIGILYDETDNLGVTADINFTSPLGINQSVSAWGTAITGAVSDAAVDYMLDWNPVLVNFGLGGLFEIALNDLSFTGIDRKILTATITLLQIDEAQRQGETQSQDESPSFPGETPLQGGQPSTNGVGAVPEPATLTLLTLGLFGFTALRRRPAKRLSYSLKIN